MFGSSSSFSSYYSARTVTQTAVAVAAAKHEKFRTIQLPVWSDFFVFV